MNAVVLVGRLVANPEIVTTENDKKLTAVTLAVHRNYKNTDGVYETDFIRCILWNGVAATTCEYCHAGDVVGIKGRLETRSYEDEKKEKKYITEVIADRVTFLSSKKVDDVEPVEEKDEKPSKKKKNKADE
jgi:single-strand DNA-binding protein